MSERSRSSASVPLDKASDLVEFEYQIHCDEDTDEITWNPPIDSRELSTALKVKFPWLKTPKERMQAAMEKFMIENRSQDSTSSPRAHTTLQAQRPSPGDSMMSHKSDFTVSSIKDMSKIQLADESDGSSVFSKASPLTTGKKIRKRKRQFEPSEKNEVRLNRITKAVCAAHKYNKVKCRPSGPNACKNNKLYQKFQQGRDSESSSLNQELPLRNSAPTDLNLSQLESNQMIDTRTIHLQSRRQAEHLAPLITQPQLANEHDISNQLPYPNDLFLPEAQASLQYGLQHNAHLLQGFNFQDDQYIPDPSDQDIYQSMLSVPAPELPFVSPQGQFKSQQTEGLDYYNSDPLPTFSPSHQGAFNFSQDLIHQPSIAQEHYQDGASFDDQDLRHYKGGSGFEDQGRLDQCCIGPVHDQDGAGFHDQDNNFKDGDRDLHISMKETTISSLSDKKSKAGRWIFIRKKKRLSKRWRMRGLPILSKAVE